MLKQGTNIRLSVLLQLSGPPGSSLVQRCTSAGAGLRQGLEQP